jgi:succinate-semialdehyde dehydrogenase/glutarate-semialdehyde dehydrogenase
MPLGGRFFEPTILTGVTRRQWRLQRRRRLGPVAPLFSVQERRQTPSRSQMTRSIGLAAYFYGRDVARVWRVAEALEYGIVGINTGHDLDRGCPLRRS